MRGTPENMQLLPRYDNVVSEIKDFLEERVKVCRAAGVALDRLVIDPGFGFGKTLEHNLELLRHLGRLGEASREGVASAALPIMVGVSRKSMVGRLTGRPTGERIYGSIALALIAVLNGARIVRVHDVAATVDALKVATAVMWPPQDGN
jgi:dihydropteroate synthase